MFRYLIYYIHKFLISSIFLAIIILSAKINKVVEKKRFILKSLVFFEITVMIFKVYHHI